MGHLLTLSASVGRGDAPFLGKLYTDGDLCADTWVATDAFGRVQPDIAEAGPVNKDKFVGICYWTWHIPRTGGPNDNTKLIAAAKQGKVDWPENGCPHHWGEPEVALHPMAPIS
jgi:hypothetical protein